MPHVLANEATKQKPGCRETKFPAPEGDSRHVATDKVIDPVTTLSTPEAFRPSATRIQVGFPQTLPLVTKPQDLT